MEKKIIYQINPYMSYIGITPNKPYLVLDEKSKFEIKRKNSKIFELVKAGTQYQIQDDYFNIRWVDSFWFFEICELRDDRINKLLD